MTYNKFAISTFMGIGICSENYEKWFPMKIEPFTELCLHVCTAYWYLLPYLDMINK